MGQPLECPAAMRTRAVAAEPDDSSDRTECAAMPANNARARTPENRERASDAAGMSADKPKRPSRSGCCGRCRIGPSKSIVSSEKCSASGSSSDRYLRRSEESRFSTVSSMECSSRTAVLPIGSRQTRERGPDVAEPDGTVRVLPEWSTAYLDRVVPATSSALVSYGERGHDPRHGTYPGMDGLSSRSLEDCMFLYRHGVASCRDRYGKLYFS